jgi:hypothetical protein
MTTLLHAHVLMFPRASKTVIEILHTELSRGALVITPAFRHRLRCKLALFPCQGRRGVIPHLSSSRQEWRPRTLIGHLFLPTPLSLEVIVF